ncbi:MAG: histidinol dehydrogenase [Candidatus Nanopelagicales bacterium]
MLRTWDLTGANWPTGIKRRLEVPRSRIDVDSVMAATKEIIEQVRVGTQETVLSLSEKFDGIRPQSLRVPQEVIDQAVADSTEDFRAALLEAASRVSVVSKAQLPTQIETEVISGGLVTGQWRAIERVGLYVPGGRAAYPSSVVMNVVPAQVAGVGSMMIMSPPNEMNHGWPHKSILAAAGLLGISEIYAVGGAQAIAMAAYGIGCDTVDLVTGPGNIYVTAAKRALAGTVGIDSEAGPTEVGIIADESADPKFVAADLISQAEHDVVAAAVLITTSKKLIDQVNQQLEIQITKTKHKERITQALTGVQSMAILVDTMDAAIEVSNSYAAEHLEIHTANARQVAEKVKNAGAVFIGNYSPVSLGDYLAGSNHVLPTGGCACHTAGLSVLTFLKLVNFIEYSNEALVNSADMLRTLALSEDLPAHWEAVNIRLAARDE